MRAALRDRDPFDLDTAELLTAEVASNAARHGTEPIDLSIAIEEQGLRVSVFDRGSGFDPMNQTPRGRGLSLIEGLSTDWGVDVRQEGTEVWFTI